MSISLKKLIEGMNIEKTYGDTHIDINKIEYNSTKIEHNDLFVAIRGFQTDGHSFINDAIKNGAICVVAEKDQNYSVRAEILVKDSRMALAFLSDKFYDSPSSKLKVIGITGTNGKTTVSYLLKSILETKERKIGLVGTIAHHIGDQQVPALNTTPESLDLQRMFYQMLEQGIKYVVMEVSSHSLALKRVEKIDFDVAVFTNLTQDHLDFHKDMESYKKTKGKLFEMLVKPEDRAVINLDDPNWEYFFEKAEVPKVTYSLRNKEADVFVEKMSHDLKGLKINFSTPLGQFEARLNLIGEQNVYNALAAIASSIVLGFGLENIKSGLEKAKVVPGRLEKVNLGQPFDILIDYAHTPDALERVLVTAKQLTSGKLIALFGCGGDRDKTKRPIMGKLATRIADYVIVTSDNPRTENPSSIIDDIFKGINSKNNIKRIEDRKEAIKKAMDLAQPKDILVIAGKGHEDYQIIGTKRFHFSDKETVKEILKKMGYKGND
ncbi:MAG: UDP-N-acetylmuramoyl-L-alanyl-D-glutamate--2,6-diaminopimelate ligase [candidate division Zixibacteria bacterium]|nr:UDP-N-acetylmuramoyl-L-alanyl-D-glutamate--2,6-diaminopimelate ligase [candidate division Zixibacteria bacterium]